MKNALLVGINEYACCPLQGCVNDVLAMEHFLSGRDFSIKKLLDTDATTSNVLTALKALVSNAKHGDTILFHFSGHGSQVPNHDGPQKEADGMEEIICTQDINFYNGTYITCHELNGIFAMLPQGVTAEVVLDCCHSGTGLRDINPYAGAVRHIPTPTDLKEKRNLSSREIVLIDPNAQNNVVLWAACAYNETAADAQIDSVFHGAFTYALLSTLQQSDVLARGQLENSIVSLMRLNNWQQTPQLECTDQEQSVGFLVASTLNTKLPEKGAVKMAVKTQENVVKPEPEKVVVKPEPVEKPKEKDIPDTTGLHILEGLVEIGDAVVDVIHSVENKFKAFPVSMKKTGKPAKAVGIKGTSKSDDITRLK